MQTSVLEFLAFLNSYFLATGRRPLECGSMPKWTAAQWKAWRLKKQGFFSPASKSMDAAPAESGKHPAKAMKDTYKDVLTANTAALLGTPAAAGHVLRSIDVPTATVETTTVDPSQIPADPSKDAQSLGERRKLLEEKLKALTQYMATLTEGDDAEEIDMLRSKVSDLKLQIRSAVEVSTASLESAARSAAEADLKMQRLRVHFEGARNQYNSAVLERDEAFCHLENLRKAVKAQSMVLLVYGDDLDRATPTGVPRSGLEHLPLDRNRASPGDLAALIDRPVVLARPIACLFFRITFRLPGPL